MKWIALFAVGLGIAAPGMAQGQELPDAVVRAGITDRAFDLKPMKGMIAREQTHPAHFYSWNWDGPVGGDKAVQTSDGVALRLGGAIETVTSIGREGVLPTLRVSQGVFVEVEMALSGNDPSAWPEIYLMPVQHLSGKIPQASGKPANWEDYTQIVIERGDSQYSQLGSVLRYTGVWGEGQQQTNLLNFTTGSGLDRTRKHRFGFSYDPSTRMARWYLDGVASKASEVSFLSDHDYYLTIGANSYSGRDYLALISNVRAYTR